MFGIGKPRTEQDADKERQIETQKNAARLLLLEMHDATPDVAARSVDRIKIFLQNDKVLPFAVRQKIMTRMRALECEANMRAADRLLREAAALMDRGELRERGLKLAESRRHFGKVCSLGGDHDWRKAYQRLCETIMMSGAVQFHGPTRAKPLDTAPKAPNRAKPDEEGGTK